MASQHLRRHYNTGMQALWPILDHRSGAVRLFQNPVFNPLDPPLLGEEKRDLGTPPSAGRMNPAPLLRASDQGHGTHAWEDSCKCLIYHAPAGTPRNHRRGGVLAPSRDSLRLRLEDTSSSLPAKRLCPSAHPCEVPVSFPRRRESRKRKPTRPAAQTAFQPLGLPLSSNLSLRGAEGDAAISGGGDCFAFSSRRPENGSQ